jgi:predicted RNase H-like HicB family nuclease
MADSEAAALVCAEQLRQLRLARFLTDSPACQCRRPAVRLFLGPPMALQQLRRGLLFQEFAVKYTVLIQASDEGFAVSVPGLPGCHSQGETESEALANITEAIREYLDVVEELAKSAGTKQVVVEV